MKHKIALLTVNPNVSPESGVYFNLPLSLGSIKAFCLADPSLKINYQFQIFSTCVRSSDAENRKAKFLDLILKYRPAIVGIHINQWNRRFFMKFCRELKARNSRIMILLFGFDIEANPAKARQDFPSMDYLLPDDVELSFRFFLRQCMAGQADSLPTSKAHVLKSLSTLPSPFLTGALSKFIGRQKAMIIEHYRKEVSDDFGPRWRNDDFSWRFASRKRMLDELKFASKIGANGLVFEGPVLNPTKEWVRFLAFAYDKVFRRDEIPILYAKLQPDNSLGRNELYLLKKTRHLEIDFQSTNSEVRRFYRRKCPYQTYERTINFLRRNAIRVILNVFVGLPGDNMNGLLETLRSAYFLQPYQINIKPFSVIPKTYFFVHSKQYGIGFQKNPPYEITRHYYAHPSDIHWQFRIAKASARTYNYWSKLVNQERKK